MSRLSFSVLYFRLFIFHIDWNRLLFVLGLLAEELGLILSQVADASHIIISTDGENIWKIENCVNACNVTTMRYLESNYNTYDE